MIKLRRRNWISLVSYSVATAALLLSAQLLTTEVSAVLTIVAGVTTMYALAAAAELTGGKTYPSLEINDAFLTESIKFAVPDLFTEGVNHFVPRKSYWRIFDKTPKELLATDKELAIANLRLELESVLREMARELEAPVLIRELDVLTLTNLLIDQGVLPNSLLYPIRDVLEASDKVLHGYDVEDKVAQRFLSVGNMLLAALITIGYRRNPDRG